MSHGIGPGWSKEPEKPLNSLQKLANHKVVGAIYLSQTTRVGFFGVRSIFAYFDVFFVLAQNLDEKERYLTLVFLLVENK